MSDLLTTMPCAEMYQSSTSSNAEDPKDSILKTIQNELDKHRMREVLEIFKNSVITEVQKNGSYIVWDLVPIICQRLRGLNEFRFKTFNCCRQILLELCDVCNPKELLIIYLSELENDLNIARTLKNDSSSIQDENSQEENDSDDLAGDFEITDSNCFKALLKPFEVILLKLPKKRNETLKSVLSSLNEHVSRLSLSVIENYDFELNDRLKLMSDPRVKNLNSVVSMYVDFLETFVREVDITNGDQNYQFYSKTSVPNIQRMILLKTLIRILDYPLKYLDLVNLEADNKPQVKETNASDLIMPSILDEKGISSRCIAVKVVKLISCLHSNFYTLLNRTDLVTSEEIIVNNSEFSDIYLSNENFKSASAVICYLLATESELSPSNFMPRVYTHVYNLSVHLPYVRLLLDSNLFLIYDKGLELLASLLEPIKEESLEAKFLDLLRQMPIEKSLISIMVFSPNKSRRTLANDLFKSLLYCFEPVGRYKILYSVLSQPRQHSGVQGVVVGLYKDILFSNPIFQGSNLHRIVRAMISISLPAEASSDVLDKNDLIFAILNFFRFILLRDPKSTNATRIWDILIVITENFLKPLHKALDVTRTHFKLELCKIKDMKINNKKSGKNKESKMQMNVIEKNSLVPIPEMTLAQEHQIILLALQNFDLIESVLVRLKEIIEEQ